MQVCTFACCNIREIKCVCDMCAHDSLQRCKVASETSLISLIWGTESIVRAQPMLHAPN